MVSEVLLFEVQDESKLADGKYLHQQILIATPTKHTLNLFHTEFMCLTLTFACRHLRRLNVTNSLWYPS